MAAYVSLSEVPNCQSSYVRGGLFPSSHDGEKRGMEPASMALPILSPPSFPWQLCSTPGALPAPSLSLQTWE